MIRINLLPVRAVKKREAGRQILVLFAVLLVAAVGGNAFWYQQRAAEQAKNQQKIKVTQEQIKKLQQVIGDIDNINKRKKEVEEKLRVLGDLRKGRSGPVKLLDALATATPKKVWLEDFDEKANAAKIKGTAISHDDVADFMRQLHNVVWTPKGMGRLVEQKRDAKSSRVELLTGDGAIEDFPVGDVSFFFSNIELKKTSQVNVKEAASAATSKSVQFEISMSVNYAA
jgi:type IV pilus assembly protein PilN